MTISSDDLDGIATVSVLRGTEARTDATPDLLVEVPHGADRRAHYDALRARLAGDLPEDLQVFFHANTDTGAWGYGRRVAELVLERDPTRSALLVRCLIPRTFVDTNRYVASKDALAEGGLTAGIPSYVRNDDDRALLLSMHARYQALVDRAFTEVCGNGGFALLPHSYGPRTMDIKRVDDDIVAKLRAAYAPEVWPTWPLRPEIDLITKDEEGVSYAPDGMADALLARYRDLGYTAVDSETYTLHPSAQASRHAMRYPGQTLALEVRRDVLVEHFDLFEELTVAPASIERIAGPLADVVEDWLRPSRRPQPS